MTGRASSDRGSATVWVLALGGVLAVVAAAVVVVGLAMVARHRATTAADLAALAAAGAAVLGEAQPCSVAEEVAAANAATLTRCSSGVGAETEVEVEVGLDLGPLGRHSAPARARAGTVPADGSAVGAAVSGG